MKKEKKSGCMAGVAVGSALKAIAIGLMELTKLIGKLLIFFGLWLPFVYAVFGVILYYALHFNPFNWTLEGQLYTSGFVACVICSVIISIKNLIIKPVKSVAKGFKTPIWTKVPIEEKENIAPITKRKKGIMDTSTILEKPRPSIYYSTLEENTLIHEYEDRFEIYRLEGNKAKLERVEYKDEG